jgi:hypothetical protein
VEEDHLSHVAFPNPLVWQFWQAGKSRIASNKGSSLDNYVSDYSVMPRLLQGR